MTKMTNLDSDSDRVKNMKRRLRFEIGKYFDDDLEPDSLVSIAASLDPETMSLVALRETRDKTIALLKLFILDAIRVESENNDDNELVSVSDDGLSQFAQAREQSEIAKATSILEHLWKKADAGVIKEKGGENLPDKDYTLEFWNHLSRDRNMSSYLLLFVKSYLEIPAASSFLERSFSSAAFVLGKRYSMDPEMLQNLWFLRAFFLKHKDLSNERIAEMVNSYM